MVHVDDVARAVELLLTADQVAGEVYNCCAGYVSDWELANLAQAHAGSSSVIAGGPRQPKNQICTTKLQALGMVFSDSTRVDETVSQLVQRLRSRSC